MKNPGWELSLEYVNGAIRVMNNFGDLISRLTTDTGKLLYPFLKVHTIVLKQLTVSFESTRHLSVKFLTM